MSSIHQTVKTRLLVLDEGPHHVVVFKPSNMVVVTGRGAPKPTLLDLAQQQFKAQIKPVHRLDRVTTGCCLLAKTTYGQQALSNAFRKHLIHKTYWAIVEGNPNFRQINCDARLKRVGTPNNKKSLAHQVVTEDGERALTRFKVLAQGDGFAWIEANPITGRMHQIRVHLAHLGFPIVGDALYGAKTAYEPHAIALHAQSVSFPAPEGGRREVKAEPDSIFKAFLGRFSSQH